MIIGELARVQLWIERRMSWLIGGVMVQLEIFLFAIESRTIGSQWTIAEFWMFAVRKKLSNFTSNLNSESSHRPRSRGTFEHHFSLSRPLRASPKPSSRSSDKSRRFLSPRRQTLNNFSIGCGFQLRLLTIRLITIEAFFASRASFRRFSVHNVVKSDA